MVVCTLTLDLGLSQAIPQWDADTPYQLAVHLPLVNTSSWSMACVLSLKSNLRTTIMQSSVAGHIKM